jgi:hypothetical protein
MRLLLRFTRRCASESTLSLSWTLYRDAICHGRQCSSNVRTAARSRGRARVKLDLNNTPGRKVDKRSRDYIALLMLVLMGLPLPVRAVGSDISK